MPLRDPTPAQKIVARVHNALAAQGAPPLDRGLRSILGQQVNNLLRGGWTADEIGRMAVALALEYDRFHGHKRLASLQGRMEQDDERRKEREHIERLAIERADGLTPEVIRALGLQRAALPSGHGYVPGKAAGCRICGGPFGVHTVR